MSIEGLGFLGLRIGPEQPSPVLPLLTGPTGIASAATTADLEVTTDFAAGDIWWVVTESATTPSQAQVKAGLDANGAAATASGQHTVTALGVQDIAVTGLDTDTAYTAHFLGRRGTVHSAVVSSNSFTTGTVPSSTLSSATAESTGDTTATIGVSTNQGNGTLHWVVTTSATTPSAAQIKAGQDHAGAAAAADGSQAVSATGAQSVPVAGLSAETIYFAHFVHTNSDDVDSNTITSAPFSSAVLLPSTNFSAYASFESIGLYLANPTLDIDANATITARYRVNGSGSGWTHFSTMPLVRTVDFLTLVVEWRGSLLQLTHNTTYQVQLLLEGVPIRELIVTTRSNVFPEGNTFAIDCANHAGLVVDGLQVAPLLIDSSYSGTAEGYSIIEPADPDVNTLDGTNVLNNIRFGTDVHYVIIRGFRLVNAQEIAIYGPDNNLTNSVTDIVIHGNEITNWGGSNTLAANCCDKPAHAGEAACATGSGPDHDGPWGLNRHDALRCTSGNGRGYRRITFQRNWVHDPRYGANDWASYRHDGEVGGKCCPLPTDPSGWLDGQENRCHPQGPHGVSLMDTHGEHVIRWNDFVNGEDDRRWFNDCIEFAPSGNIGNTNGRGDEIEVYENDFRGVWDDTIQADFQGRNLRVWGNHATSVNNFLSLAPLNRGPAYVFLNHLDITRENRNPATLTRTGHFIKWAFKGKIKSSGRIYVFHNTAGGASPTSGVLHAVRASTAQDADAINLWSRNNLYLTEGDSYLTGEYLDAPYSVSIGNPPTSYTHPSMGSQNNTDIDYDLVTTAPHVNAPYGANMLIGAVPVFENGIELADASPGRGDGIVIPGLNIYVGGVADMGAQQRGGETLQYGRFAHLEPAGDPVDDLVAAPSLQPAAADLTFSDLEGITVYQFRHQEESAPNPSPALMLAASKVAQTTDLLPGLTYDISVRGKSADSVTPWSDPATVTIAVYPIWTADPVAVPDTATTMKFRLTLTEDATVFWTRYAAGTAVPAAADIIAATDADDDGSEAAQADTEKEITVTGLTDGVSYLFAFVARMASNTLSFVKTVTAAPSAGSYSDDFNRADAAVEAGDGADIWEVTDGPAGEWTVRSNMLAKTGTVQATKCQVLFKRDLATYAHFLEFDPATTVTGNQVRMVFSVAGVENYVAWRGSGTTWELVRRKPGADTVIGSWAHGGSLARVRLEARMEGGTHQVRLLTWDGAAFVERIGWINSGATPGTRAGMWSFTAATRNPVADNVTYGVIA